MSEIGEAVEGVVAFVLAGFFLLMIATPLQSVTEMNLGLFGIVLILLGVVLGVALLAKLLGGLIGR